MKLLRLLRTLKYLRWEQIAYRPLRMAQYGLYRKFPRLTRRWSNPADNTPVVEKETLERFREVFVNSFAHLNRRREKTTLEIAASRFTFLNRTIRLNSIDWNRRYENHLWNYHLHYFNYAIPCALGFVENGDNPATEACRKLIENWIAEARIGHSDGWEAYPISLRTVNWIYSYAMIEERCEDKAFLQSWRSSIYLQLDFLSRHLELHLLANHLLKNVKALVIGGLFFGNRSWLENGVRLLRRELAEQVLEDGGHYERSPMYHAQALQDFLECHALLRAFGEDGLEATAESKLRSMTSFLEAMTYPDGTIALFNDSADTDETKSPPTIESSRRICGYVENSYLKEFSLTGYYLWESADRSEKIIVDAGPPAVDYNAAHAHCDLLSYELSIGGKPLIIDSGLHGYEGDAYREYCRSTRAHNTVMFDGLEQSELWGTFRMARRARIIAAKTSSDDRNWSFKGSFRRFDGLIHERSISRHNDGSWLIADKTESAGARKASSYIHLHPRVSHVNIEEDRVAVIHSPDLPQIRIEPTDELQSVRVDYGLDNPVQGWRFPDFGIAEKSRTISFEFKTAPGRMFGYKISKY